MTASWVDGAIAAAAIYSDAFLLLAPVVLAIAIAKAPRTALYVASEAPVLLGVVFTIRYADVFSNLFSQAHLFEKLHLVALYYLAFAVIRCHRRAFIPKPTSPPASPDAEPLIALDSTENDDQDEWEKEAAVPTTQTEAEERATARQLMDAKTGGMLTFNWRQIGKDRKSVV